MQSTESSYSVPPFPAFPSTSRYVPLGPVQDAMGRVCRSVDAREAISLVIGPPGTGKSLICGLLAEHYRSDHDVVVMGETCVEDRAAFLRHLLHALEVNLENVPGGDLQLALVDRVCDTSSTEGGLLLIVDEAQSLSMEVLEAIRMVTNINREGQPRVSAVLCGGVKLDETMADASMESFTQRVATRCYLHPLNSEETRRYISETIRNCGAESEETITDEAISAVHHACSGVPRLINQMVTQAIDCAEEADQAQITEQIVDAAWAQLQQLPSPMVDEPKITRDAAPVEFGELDDSMEFGQWSDTKETDLEETNAIDPVDATDEPIETEDAEQDACDIKVESPTAHWIDEPELAEPEVETEMNQSSTESPGQLFGQFEDEEDIALGTGVLPRSATTCSAPPANLEAMLHQEIVGVTSIEQGEIVADSPAAPIGCEDVEVVEENEETVNDLIIVDDDTATVSQENENAVLWIAEPEENADVEEETLRDDRDILVIEDEIELQRVDPAARVDSKDQTISVDFQAMLSRMRSTS